MGSKGRVCGYHSSARLKIHGQSFKQCGGPAPNLHTGKFCVRACLALSNKNNYQASIHTLPQKQRLTTSSSKGHEVTWQASALNQRYLCMLAMNSTYPVINNLSKEGLLNKLLANIQTSGPVFILVV